MYTAFLTWNTLLTTVKNLASPLRLLGGRSGDTQETGTSKEAGGLQIGTELFGNMYTAFST